jgi:hydroxyacyl-ACP dehydratase HTD2-like protein with hotdog domain
MPIVCSLGPSGYPALQNFLLHVLDKNRMFSSGKRMFLVFFAAVTFELLEEAI